MIKRIVVIFIALIGSLTYAQQGTASPYSFYGIGSLKFKGTVENRGMGSIGSYIDSLHINLRNPASYAGRDLKAKPYYGESRPVKFSVAGSFSSIDLESQTSSQNTGTATFDYVAVSLPLGRFGAGFGLLPFTSVGYKLEDTNAALNNRLENRYEGEGGLNKVFFSLGYLVNDNLSVGVDVNYNFGNTQNSAREFLYDNDGDLILVSTTENTRSDLSGLNFNFGAAYQGKLFDDLEFSVTTTYAPQSSLTSLNEQSISTILIRPEGEFLQNTIDVDLASNNLDETDLDLPSRFSLGFGIGETSKWFLGTEYVFQNTSVFNNPVFSTTNSAFENAESYSIGGFYVPNYRSLSSYFQRVTYRAGARFENTGLIINDESIDEFGISFGLGLPIGSTTNGMLSEINLGFEYGQRGTKDSNLIEENFFNLNVSLTLNGRWFQKRKYD